MPKITRGQIFNHRDGMSELKKFEEKLTMPTPPTHTPMPWKVAHYEGGLLEGLNFIEGSDKMEVCIINDATPCGKANAAYIVECVNSHAALKAAKAELVEAMHSAVRALEAGMDDPGHVQNCSGHELTMDCVIDDLKQAIARAEGKI